MNQNRTAPPPAHKSPLTENHEPDIQENEDEKAPVLPSDLQDFLSHVSYEEGQTYTARLYRFEQSLRRPRRITCEEYEAYIPSLKEIGTEYGSGEYEIIASWYQGVGKPRGLQSARFTLDKKWDRVRDAAAAPAPPKPPETTSQVFGIVKDVIGTIAPLMLARSQAAPEGNPASQTSALMETLNGTMTRLLESNFQNALSMQSKVLDMMQPQEPEEKDDSAISKIVDALHTFIPLFSSMPQAAVQPMANAVRDRPEVQQVLASKTRQAVLYHKIRREFDPATADKVCGLFGVKPPENTEAQKQPTPPSPSAKGKNGKAKK